MPNKRMVVTVLKTIRWQWLAFAAVIGLLIVFLTTLPGQISQYSTINLGLFSRSGPAVWCLLTACPQTHHIFWFVMINVVGNIVVFIPFGFGLTAAVRRYAFKRYTVLFIVLLGFSLSFVVEVTQLYIPGRTTDVDDLVFNTLGTIVGLSLWFLVGKVYNKSSSEFTTRKDKLQ